MAGSLIVPATRRPSTPADAHALKELYDAYDTAELGAPEVELTDITAMLDLDDCERLVVEDDGRVVGYADVARSGEVESLVRPSYPEARALQRELIAWAVERATARRAGRIEHFGGARPDGVGALLADEGFEHARTIWLMRRDLTGDLPTPVWPDGVSLQDFDRERAGRAVWQLVMTSFAGSYGSHERPFEEWSKFALAPGNDVVCAEEGGVLVAVATVGPRGGEGHVGQLAVPSQHRGRGLALALLHECFRRDAAAGYAATTLTVDGENERARRLYEKAGMQVVKEYRRWERDV